MHDVDRFKLLHGPYRMPRCRVGRLLRCTLRGMVRVVGISAGRIQWPQCRVGGKDRGGMLAMVICGDLERAIRTESNQAVAYWWGITPYTVSQWRKRLNVGRYTEGTQRLQREVFVETLDNGAREKLLASLYSPGRAAKIGAAHRGKKPPPEAVERARRANTGRRRSAETRARMAQAQRQRYAREARWTAEKDGQLGTASDCDLARRWGLNSSSVQRRRLKLGIPAFTPAGPGR